MKRTLLIILALSLLSIQLDAAPCIKPRPHTPRRHHLHRRFQPSPIVKSISQIPWQTVAAGGAAVSGVLFAYKVADGIQTGTIEAARSSPDAFIQKGANAMETVKALGLIGVFSFIGLVVWRLARQRKPPA
jgi:hypothetical protein